MGAARGLSRARRALSSNLGDLWSVLAIAALALLFLSPALKDGASFGGFDLDTTLTSLGDALRTVVHSVKNGDAVSQMVSWNALDWRMVHSGHFPLWNDYSVLGMPEFLNFESSVLSLPDLVSYAIPLPTAFLVAVLVKLLLAGWGTYLCARVLSLRPLAALFAGAGYMLSGAFVNWVTWPLSDVVAWAGFVLAFALLAYRSGKWRFVVGLAVSIAFSIFGGFPEANVLLALGLGAFAVGALVARLVARVRVDVSGGLRVVGGALLGAAIAAPLWLPGLSVIDLSHRAHNTGHPGLPMKALAMTLAQGFDGLPAGPNAASALRSWAYYESVAYVGVPVAILALVGLWCARRRPAIAGLLVALVVCFAATYEPRGFHPFYSLVDHVSALRPIEWSRGRVLVGFFAVLLAAFGLEQLLKERPPPSLRRVWAVATVAVSAVVVYLAIDSAGGRFVSSLGAYRAVLAPAQLAALRHQRLESLVWPAVLCALFFAALPFLGARSRVRTRALVAAAAVLAEVAFLFFAGVGVPSYSPRFYATTTAIRELQSAVGSGLLGLDNGNVGSVRNFGGKGLPRPVGLLPNVNLGYSLRLFGVHDPLTPSAYFTSWPQRAAAPVAGGVGQFVPAITSAALARRYGINAVLVAAGLPAPPGMTYLETIAGERLFVVPGAARFSFVDGKGSVGRLTDNGDGAYAFTTSAPLPARLVLRVTAVPGWHLTVDGHELALSPYDGVMESAVIPAGHHVVALTYFPTRLGTGLWLAGGAVAVLVAGGAVSIARSRRARGADAAPEGSADSHL